MAQFGTNRKRATTARGGSQNRSGRESDDPKAGAPYVAPRRTFSPMTDARKQLYAEFLETPRWRKLRRKVLKRDQHTCRKCGSTDNLRVHHKRYRQDPAQWGTEPLEWLVTLCDPCHQKEHRRLLRRKKAKWRKINQKRRVR